VVFNALDMLVMVAKRKYFFIVNVVIITSLAIVYSLVAEKRYQATAVLMVPEESGLSIMSLMGGQSGLSKMGKLGGSLLSPNSGTENTYLAIIKSRALGIDVIKRFQLPVVYKFNRKKIYYMEEVLKVFNKNVKTDLPDDGTIHLTVQDVDPERAAQMANYIAEKLDTIYRNLSTETARNQRVFLEGRYAAIKNDLTESEQDVNDFQKKHKITSLTDQMKATIDASATLEAQLMAAKLSLSMAKEVYSSDEPKMKGLELEIHELTKQQNTLQNTRNSDLLIPLNLAPDLGLEYARLKRNLLIQETLFDFVSELYEKARFDEARNTPVVQVLDKADAPHLRSSPKRSIIVLTVFCLSIIEGFFLIFLLEYFKSIKNSRNDEYEKLVQLKNYIFS
jgi:uncharacterized protein involved in exopolysaccharide biosynthesis